MGVAGIIAPWNSLVVLFVHPLGPALATISAAISGYVICRVVSLIMLQAIFLGLSHGSIALGDRLLLTANRLQHCMPTYPDGDADQFHRDGPKPFSRWPSASRLVFGCGRTDQNPADRRAFRSSP